MAVPIIATAGSASANSLAELAEADAYFGERLGGNVWTDIADDDVRSRALITASREISAEVYRGARSSSTQKMAWPRVGTYLGGVPLDSTLVPAFVKEATYEQAIARLVASGTTGTTDPLAPSGTEQFKAIGVGDIKLDFRDIDATGNSPAAADDPSKYLAPAAYRLLRPYLLSAEVNQIFGARNVRLRK